MAVTVTHATVTAVPDDPAYDIGSDEWNAAHTVTGLGTAATSAATDFVAVTGDQMTGALAIDLGTITTSTPAWNVTQTWNDGAVTFTGLKLNVTATASAGGSMLMDLQVGGASKFFVRKDGVVVAPYVFAIYDSGSYYWAQVSTNQQHQNVGKIVWTDGDALGGSTDTGINRNAAGVLEVNNGTGGTYRDLLARNLVSSPTTVAGLTAAQTGARSFVTDANATTFASIVAGGGANGVPVYYDGTNWRIG